MTHNIQWFTQSYLQMTKMYSKYDRTEGQLCTMNRLYVLYIKHVNRMKIIIWEQWYSWKL